PKELSLAGALELAAPLPKGDPTAGGYPLTTPVQAVDELRANLQAGGPGGPTPRIVDVELGRGGYSTHRGRQRRPPGVSPIAGIPDTMAGLAVAPPGRFASPVPFPSQYRVIGFSSSASTFTIEYEGGPPGTGPCEAEYTADVTQAPWAVGVSIREKPPVTHYT